MKSWKIASIVVAVAVVAAAVFTASAYAMMNGQIYGMHGANTAGNYGYYGNMMNNVSPNGPGYYGNMMNGGTPTGMGGMMNGYVYNQQGTDCGDHGQIANYPTNGANPISITTAQTNAQNYLTNLNNPDLTIKQVEEYSNNFYVQVTEKSTGNGAFELLINKYTGSIYPEMGPNMMWNTKYGMMRSGILGGIFGTPTTTMTVTPAQATTDAQAYLNNYISGATTGDVNTFYGYYTIEVLNGATTYGMLSVNGYTGQVWFHTWHGTFVSELQMS